MREAKLDTGDKVQRVRDGRIGYLSRFIGYTYRPDWFEFKDEKGGHWGEHPASAFVLLERNPLRDLGKNRRTRRRRPRRRARTT